jgi:hypothetical protein
MISRRHSARACEGQAASVCALRVGAREGQVMHMRTVRMSARARGK